MNSNLLAANSNKARPSNLLAMQETTFHPRITVNMEGLEQILAACQALDMCTPKPEQIHKLVFD